MARHPRVLEPMQSEAFAKSSQLLQMLPLIQRLLHGRPRHLYGMHLIQALAAVAVKSDPSPHEGAFKV
eukprot:CAMPEP_0115163742 /NCGR_PEP_ID=MMETSP0227-20121206/72671_1 /TAXON_ID=89957 /ORGANISM="Polarella glacialis, Strain CCMP 1383" /LENGTH=67 /DNA_ID=CAMNT_0002576067 /DNA_START=572 /DNA_END=772 /DNA_ORIENTATION=-